MEIPPGMCVSRGDVLYQKLLGKAVCVSLEGEDPGFERYRINTLAPAVTAEVITNIVFREAKSKICQMIEKLTRGIVTPSDIISCCHISTDGIYAAPKVRYASSLHG